MSGYKVSSAFQFDVADTEHGPHPLREVWVLLPMDNTWGWVITEYFHATVTLLDGSWMVDRTPTMMSHAFGRPGAELTFDSDLADAIEAHMNTFGMPARDAVTG